MTGSSVGILATGSYLPAHEVTSAELAERIGVPADWIERKTQIRSRRYAAPDEATSDLAIRAAARALAQGRLAANEVDYLVVATSTGDSPQPPTSYVVQHALGATRAACFDINVVCSGFVYGLAVARGLLALRPDACALVVAADVYSRILDFSDRRTAALFGDGAGAAVVGAAPDPYGVLDLELSSHGDARLLVGVAAGGSRQPPSHATVDAGGHFFRMDGRGVTDFVLGTLPLAVKRLVARAGTTLDAIDHFVPHQANGVLLQRLAESSGLAHAYTPGTVERYGNVGSASLPVALDEANRTGHLGDGDLVLLAGFGGGMSIGLSLLRWAATF